MIIMYFQIMEKKSMKQPDIELDEKEQARKRWLNNMTSQTFTKNSPNNK